MRQPWPHGRKFVMKKWKEVCDLLEIPDPCRTCQFAYVGISVDTDVLVDTMLDTEHHKTWEYWYMQGIGKLDALCTASDEGFYSMGDTLFEEGWKGKGQPTCFMKGQVHVLVPRWIVKKELEKKRDIDERQEDVEGNEA